MNACGGRLNETHLLVRAHAHAVLAAHGLECAQTCRTRTRQLGYPIALGRGRLRCERRAGGTKAGGDWDWYNGRRSEAFEAVLREPPRHVTHLQHCGCGCDKQTGRGGPVTTKQRGPETHVPPTSAHAEATPSCSATLFGIGLGSRRGTGICTHQRARACWPPCAVHGRARWSSSSTGAERPPSERIVLNGLQLPATPLCHRRDASYQRIVRVVVGRLRMLTTGAEGASALASASGDAEGAPARPAASSSDADGATASTHTLGRPRRSEHSLRNRLRHPRHPGERTTLRQPSRGLTAGAHAVALAVWRRAIDDQARSSGVCAYPHPMRSQRRAC